jgi:putative ABC transport system substrate-binding protein
VCSAQVGFAELDEASGKLNALEVADLQTPDDLNGAFDAMVGKQVEALLIVIGPLTYLLRQPIAELALKHRLPTITNTSQFAHAGLLMSYGPSVTDLYRRAATYVDKILRGAALAELPVEQPTKFELVVNLKAAKSLGLTVPAALIATADEVIE